AGNDLDKLRTSIATWFDDSMERLSGAYKRQLKWISMLVGLLVAIGFNADSVNVASTLWTDGDRRAAVTEMAMRVAKEGTGQKESGQGESVRKVRDEIHGVESTLRSLPIGWNCATVKASAATPPDGLWSPIKEFVGYYGGCAWTNARTVTLRNILGWILTAGA